jgi:predicted permease
VGWREAWRLSDAPYTEIAFQAIYALRQGNLPSSTPDDELADRARRRVAQSKIMVSFVLGLVAVGTYFFLSPPVEDALGGGLPRGLYVAGVLDGVLVLELALVWWTGLQILPTFLGTAALTLLETMPVEEGTLDRVGAILVFRLFDAPAITCLVLTPIAVALALDSPLAGLAIIPGVVAVVAVAVALSLLTGRFFVRRVQGARGGGRQSLVRWSYLLLWAIPAFAMYGFVTFSGQFFALIQQLWYYGPAPAFAALVLSFPFPFAALSASAPSAQGVTAPTAIDPLWAIFGTIVYLEVVVALLAWLVRAPRRLVRTTPEAGGVARAGDLRLFPSSPSWAVLRKDIRTASRTPGYAFLILLPLLDAVAIGFWTVVNPSNGDTFNLGVAAVATAALLATFFGPAFFAIEVMGYSYARTLPLPDRSVLLGKVLLVAILYVIASTLVLGLTLFRFFQPWLFIAFIAAEFPGVIAASLLELGLLFREARRRGLPIVNLYSGAWYATMVAIPGVLVASVPLVAFEFLRQGPALITFPSMGALALVELAVAGLFTLGLPGRGSP